MVADSKRPVAAADYLVWYRACLDFVTLCRLYPAKFESVNANHTVFFNGGAFGTLRQAEPADCVGVGMAAGLPRWKGRGAWCDSDDDKAADWPLHGAVGPTLDLETVPCLSTSHSKRCDIPPLGTPLTVDSPTLRRVTDLLAPPARFRASRTLGWSRSGPYSMQMSTQTELTRSARLLSQRYATDGCMTSQCGVCALCKLPTQPRPRFASSPHLTSITPRLCRCPPRTTRTP